MSFQKILVAIDNSPSCPSVFAVALELAQFNQGTLKLLHCITSEMTGEPMVPLTLDMGLAQGMLPSDYQTQQVLLKKQVEQGQVILKRYSEEAIAHGVPTECDCKFGDPGNQLCEVAEDWGADLIVLGRRGRTGLQEAILGSVSNQVMHHARCAVLVIQDVDPEQPD
jgi:nucleotide-binding universal stress UspA family protein